MVDTVFVDYIERGKWAARKATESAQLSVEEQASLSVESAKKAVISPTIRIKKDTIEANLALLDIKPKSFGEEMDDFRTCMNFLDKCLKLQTNR